ncbi:MAG: hypothetical protein M3Q78_12155, partial [Acidobacteriota bacterium]|nr:hypothetical protein [Acidobacteriota bacterium]
SPTTHGAIGFSTDLAPSMTLGCGSWGGNVTSDNVSPIHLMDIKRVAFETKPVSVPSSKFQVSSLSNAKFENNEGQKTKDEGRKTIKREEIAALVDKFLSKKIAETPIEIKSADSSAEIRNPKSEIPNQRAIIHELKTESATNGAKSKAVDFVSEDDVKQAVEKGEKIFVSAKTIITPSARDLGEETEVFAKV